MVTLLLFDNRTEHSNLTKFRAYSTYFDQHSKLFHMSVSTAALALGPLRPMGRRRPKATLGFRRGHHTIRGAISDYHL